MASYYKKKSVLVKRCECCNKEFETKQEKKKLCTVNCYAKQARDKNRTSQNKKCKNCNKDFVAYRVDKIFCSKDCQWSYRYKTKTKTNTEIKCKGCDKLFIRKSSSHLYCSKKCRSIVYSTRFYNKNKWYYKQIRRDDGTYTSEHRYIIEQKIKRRLDKNEVVHHINFDKNNNSEQNLHLFNNKQDHGFCHGSLNNIMQTLMKKNVVEFDKDKSIYKIL